MSFHVDSCAPAARELQLSQRSCRCSFTAFVRRRTHGHYSCVLQESREQRVSAAGVRHLLLATNAAPCARREREAINWRPSDLFSRRFTSSDETSDPRVRRGCSLCAMHVSAPRHKHIDRSNGLGGRMGALSRIHSVRAIKESCSSRSSRFAERHEFRASGAQIASDRLACNCTLRFNFHSYDSIGLLIANAKEQRFSYSRNSGSAICVLYCCTSGG